MDINKVAVFLVVADSGSFSRAAENLRYTQAGVSYVIKSLEEELQLQLVERNFNGVKLSRHGAILYPEFRRLLDAYNSFQASINEHKRFVDGTLHIGTIDTIATRWFADTLNRVKKKNSNIRYEAIVGTPFEINEWVESGRVDIGFSEKAWASRDYLWRDITPDPYFAVLPKGIKYDVPCKLSLFENQVFYIADYAQDRNTVSAFRIKGIVPRFFPDKISNSQIIKAATKGHGGSIISAAMLCDSALATTSEKNFPEIVKMEDNLQRTLGYQIKGADSDNEIALDFANELIHVVKEDIVWNRLISSDIWTYKDEVETIESLRSV